MTERENKIVVIGVILVFFIQEGTNFFFPGLIPALNIWERIILWIGFAFALRGVWHIIKLHK